MDKKFEELKKEYHDILIPEELDAVVNKALRQKTRKKRVTTSIVGMAAASAIFIGGLNTSPTFAKAMSEIPILESIVNVLTITEFNVNEETYNADIEVPAIENLENKSLQDALNQKYLEESKALYKQFQTDVEQLEELGGGHMGVASGYEIKTNTDQILAIGRYVENTVGSSSTTYQFDTIDKQNELLITLPSLFKSDAYIDIISEEIKRQMISQMNQDFNVIYWVDHPNQEEDMLSDLFEKIKPEQNFYINDNSKLVIVFDKYEIAPGYMGVIEFTIPTEVLSEVLVSHEYIK
nr:DUF3298 domain-containing protein [Lysinibacillus timonensis]